MKNLPALPLIAALLFLACAGAETPMPPEPPVPPVQMAVDPETGQDITARVIAERLVELRALAMEIIARAEAEHREHPADRLAVYRTAHWEIWERLGVGSIGPATAAAGPLLAEMLQTLDQRLGVSAEERDAVMSEGPPQ